MINTRIYQILKTLERKKLNRFQKFIRSPYFNINERISILTEVLIKQLKESTELESKEELWTKIYPIDVVYDDLKFRKLCNELLERFERFLINEQLDGENLLQANLLLDSIKQNKFDDLIEKQIKKSNRLIEREIDQSAEYYLRVYFNKKILQNLKTNYEKKADIKNYLSSLSYNDLTQNLDSFYVIEKLRHATDILTWRKLYKTEIELDLGFTLDLIAKYNLTTIPAVNVYMLMYRLMSGLGNNKDYTELKEISTNVIRNFPTQEQREILDVLLSYVIKDVNKGDKDAVLEMIKLYDWGVETEIILVKDYLSPTTFRNYVIGCLRLGLFDKAEYFIKNKLVLLESKYQENANNFNMARVMFYRKEYHQAIDYLSKVNYEDIWYNLDSKILQLATYYELKEMMVLESSIDSFAKYLQRRKSLDTRRSQAYLNFVKVLKVFISDPNPNKKKYIEKVETISPMLNKVWLLEKINEL